MKLILIHQHDPTIPHVGGVQTFIDTFIRNAPDNLEIHLIGVSAKPDRFPVGQWHSLSMGQKAYRFFPLVAAHPVHVTFIPLTIRMWWALFRYRKKIDLQDAILEFHRVEPMLAFLGKHNPRILVLHGHNMKDFYNRKTEVRWGKFPRLYFWLEQKLLPQADHIYIVREDAVEDYQKKYPAKANKISFLPTWVDEAVFHSLGEQERSVLREKLIQEQALSAASRIFLYVGRYEGQKDPIRLLNAFKLVLAKDSHAILILIGEGGLKVEMQNFVQEHKLSSAVRFLPPMPQEDIGQWMNAADALCLSSAFEGMPRVAVEALYCGLPVISTAVGEAGRLIGDSHGGRLVTEEGAEVFAKAMLDLVGNPPSTMACEKQVESYTARKILAPVYRYYGELSEGKE